MVAKPSKSFLAIILAVANLFLFGCSDKPLFIELHSANSESENTSSWDFSQASDYIYDPEKIEFVDGKAQLKQVDQTHEGSDFNSGTYVGTQLDGSLVTLLERPTDSSTHVNTILPSRAVNLVGYWRFDGDFTDSSTHNHNITAMGDASANGQAKLGSASGAFDGTGDYLDVDTASVLAPTAKVTMSMWIKLSTIVPAIQLFAGHGNTGLDGGYWMGYNTGGGKLIFSTADGTNGGAATYARSQVTPVVGEWIHIVGTHESGSTKIYINGDLKDTNTLVTAPLSYSPTTKFFIGNIEGLSAGRFLNGEMDELSVWNEVLTPAEVQSLYESQNSSFAELSSSWTPHWDKIVGYWKMDGNWQDSSGNGNHGAANGDATFSTDAKVGSQAGSFDGASDGAIIADDDTLDVSGDISVFVWVKFNSFATSQYMLSKRDDTDQQFGLYYYQPVDRIAFFGWNGVDEEIVLDNVGLQTDVWYLIGVTYDSATKIGKIYIDGVAETTDNTLDSIPVGTAPVYLGARGDGSGFSTLSLNGFLDSAAIWDVGLTDSEVKQIYNRQKQKYAGHYDSPVIDLGASGSWTSLTAATALPFGKEIVAGASESSSDYSALSGDLSDGLVGYWPLDEAVANSVGGSDFEDRSIESNHGDESGGVLFGESSILSKSPHFFDFGDYVTVAYDATLAPSYLSVSVWVKLDTLVGSQSILSKTENGGYALYYNHGGCANTFCFFIHDGAYHFATDPTFNVESGRWYHLIGTYDGNDVNLYINGIEEDSNPAPSGALNYVTNTPFCMGSEASPGDCSAGSNFYGKLDEVAIWSRPLTPIEIQQLYRRGANRVKYQVKSCIDSTCECKSFNTAPVGNASDCDGDGILNSVDDDDIYKAEFVGPGGNGVTTFSELFNRDSGNMAFTCNANTTDSDNDVCVDDEITLSGNSKASSPSFSFFDFPSSSRPLDNRYFQYRVLMEAEENSACGGEPCLPELTSVEIGPTGRFYSGAPSVSNNTSQSFERALKSMQVSSSSGCEMSFQISNDGNNFYYWDGTSWVAGIDVSDSNNLVTLNDNIDSFTNQVGFGDFYFKSFLGNSNFGECELDEVQIYKSSR